MRRDRRRGCLLALVVLGCSPSFGPRPCHDDEDCPQSLVCELREGEPVCVHAADAPLLIGQSAPISGTNQALGTEMKLGVELAFEEQNARGGVRGRALKLQFRDDAYQPELAEQAARALVDVRVTEASPRCPTTTKPAVAGQAPISQRALERGPNAVLALLGNVGTPTMVRSAPVAIETRTLFFGAFTGAATILRDDVAGPCDRYIFNVRASYKQEARATLELFLHRGVADHRHLISFDQDDSFGQAGYDGLLAAHRALVGPFPEGVDSAAPIARFRYTRNDDSSVPAQVAAAASYIAGLLSEQPGVHHFGIMMTDTYGAGAAFIAALRGWQFADDPQARAQDRANRLKLQFSHLSFVGPNALAQRLVAAGSIATPTGELPLTTDVTVSQVVPNYQSDSSEIVRSYNRLIAREAVEPSFTSLEGYISARVFIAGLEAHRGPFAPEALVDTFEHLPDLSLGFGVSSSFSENSHQYSNSVWGTSIEPDGSFANLYFWSEGSRISFFE